jgi:type IV pilus assembly protein PilC
MVNQVRIGERSGTMPATLKRLTNQLEHGDNLKSLIIKKLTYPCMLMVFGSGAVTFMLLYVIPTFEKTYKESHAKLPWITQFMIDLGKFGTSYGWLILVMIVGFIGSIIYIRRIPAGRLWMDLHLLRVPMLGDWFRNIAVLQFVEVLGNLMEAGFTVVDALRACTTSIGNRAIRQSVEELHGAIMRGERLSNELERHGSLFPPVVNQLVVVGEKTGTLAGVTVHIRSHLRREVERYTNVMIGSIEPIMTITLAFVIGGILLAIYLPMFDMIGSMGSNDH